MLNYECLCGFFACFWKILHWNRVSITAEIIIKAISHFRCPWLFPLSNFQLFCPWSADFHTLLCFSKLDGCRPPELADKPSDENLTGWREVKLSAGFFPFPSLRLDAGQAARHWPHLDEYAARHKRAKERDGRSGRARKGALPIRSLALHTLSDVVEMWKTAPNH